MSGANLYAAYLRGADLRESDLSGTNLEDAVLLNADLRGANLGGARFCHTVMPDGRKIKGTC